MTSGERPLEDLSPDDRLAALIEVGRTGGGLVDPDGPGWVPGDVLPSARVDPADGWPRSVQAWRVRLVDRFRGSGVRLDPGHRGAWSVALVVVLVAAVVGWRVLADRPRTAPVAVTSPYSSVPSASSSALSPVTGTTTPASTSSAALVVDVVGRVRRPGLVRLRTGSRVDDALRAVGGALPGTDLTALNLARPLVDGEQIAVGVPGAGAAEIPGSGTVGGASGAGPSAPVDLNTASVDQLDALPGVGPVLAQHIVAWRSAHGRFTSVDQLNDVSGIGDAKFADLKALVTV